MSHNLKLSDGRVIAFNEYGLKNGIPVFFFHGTPGSRYFPPPEQVMKKLGVRLITVDRPGYGWSDNQPHRKIIDFPEDISRIADFLHIGEFRIAGHSGGGPYVLACAYSLPNRVKAAAIISGAVPADTPGFIEGMSKINQFGFRVGKYLPNFLWRFLIWIVYHRRAQDPLADMERGNGIRPPADDLLLQNPEIKNTCLESEKEAFRFGLQGLSRDTRLLTYPWGFRLENISIPVFFWHGTTDDLVPIKAVQNASNKVQKSHLKIFTGEGHLLLFTHWEEILKSLIEA
jgi:pimeloyl-ACP methyl ester carboxylesterase